MNLPEIIELVKAHDTSIYDPAEVKQRILDVLLPIMNDMADEHVECLKCKDQPKVKTDGVS